jgi:orotate phosphoribosyltransferase
MAFDKKGAKERNLASLARSPGGFKFTSTFFPYTSGKIGPYFAQSGEIMTNGEDFYQAVEDMSELVREVSSSYTEGKIEVITGGETRDWIFSQAVASRLRLPCTMLYKKDKMVGASLKGRIAGHVADLNNEGSSVRDSWKPGIEAAGGSLRDTFFFIDRMEEGVNVVKNLGLGRHAVVELDSSAWDYLKVNNVVSPAQYQHLQERSENPEAWAAKMLQSYAGLQTLTALLGSSANREKANKILNVGYPELKKEIRDRLVKEIGPGAQRWFND